MVLRGLILSGVKASNGDNVRVMVRVCYRPPNQDEGRKYSTSKYRKSHAR